MEVRTSLYNEPLKVEVRTSNLTDHLRWKFIRDIWFNYRSNRIGGLDRWSLHQRVTGGMSTSTRGASHGVVRSRTRVSHESDVGGDDSSSRLWSTKEPRLRRMIVLPSVRLFGIAFLRVGISLPTMHILGSRSRSQFRCLFVDTFCLVNHRHCLLLSQRFLIHHLHLFR